MNFCVKNVSVAKSEVLERKIDFIFLNDLHLKKVFPKPEMVEILACLPQYVNRLFAKLFMSCCQDSAQVHDH